VPYPLTGSEVCQNARCRVPQRDAGGTRKPAQHGATGWHGPWYGGMNIGLRLAGTHSVVFQCGCFFARGDDTGVPGWRLCAKHVDVRQMIADAFGEDEGECVVACRLSLQRV
jgi:hypothetical protein